MNNNMKYKGLNDLFLGLWIATLVFYVLYLLNPFFLQSRDSLILSDSGDYIGSGIIETVVNILTHSFLLSNFSANNTKDITDTNNILLIYLYVGCIFFVSIFLVIEIVLKKNFLSSNNKLTRSLQYLFVSVLTLILGIVIYHRGTLVDYDSKKNIYYYKHNIVAILFAIVMILLDIPYIVVGINEKIKKHQINKTRYTLKLTLKEKICIYLKDLQNIYFIILLTITPIVSLFICISNGGIEFSDGVRKFLMIL